LRFELRLAPQRACRSNQAGQPFSIAMPQLFAFIAGAASIAASAAWLSLSDRQQAKGLAGVAVLAGLAAFFAW
jgi:hypothetical protein